MKLKDMGGYAVDIRQTDSTRHKYGSALAEYIDTRADVYYDNTSGDVESPVGWFALVGRRLVRADDRGFVDVETYADAAGASAVFDALSNMYNAWAADEDEDEDEYDEDERAAELARREDEARTVLDRESARVAARFPR